MTPDPTRDTDDGVLTPDDLLLDDDRVDELGDNRYLVRSDGPAATSDPTASETLPAVDMNGNADGAKAADAGTSPSDASENPFEWPLADADADHGLESGSGSHEPDTASDSRESDAAPESNGPVTTAEPHGPDLTSEHPLASAPDPHGIDVTLKTDGELAHLQTTSKDVRGVFAELLTWYADRLDDDLSPAQVLEVMLATTDLEA